MQTICKLLTPVEYAQENGWEKTGDGIYEKLISSASPKFIHIRVMETGKNDWIILFFHDQYGNEYGVNMGTFQSFKAVEQMIETFQNVEALAD